MRGTAKKWRLVASALALLTSAAATPRALAQPAGATQAALTPPRVAKFVEAKRPEETPAEGAAVDLELTIAADGKLTDAKVVTSAGEALDAAALEAVRQFTFEPARRGRSPGAGAHPLSLRVRPAGGRPRPPRNPPRTAARPRTPRRRQPRPGRAVSKARSSPATTTRSWSRGW